MIQPSKNSKEKNQSNNTVTHIKFLSKNLKYNKTEHEKGNIKLSLSQKCKIKFINAIQYINGVKEENDMDQINKLDWHTFMIKFLC